MCFHDKMFTTEATINAINTKFGWYYNRADCKNKLNKKV